MEHCTGTHLPNGTPTRQQRFPEKPQARPPNAYLARTVSLRGGPEKNFEDFRSVIFSAHALVADLVKGLERLPLCLFLQA